MRLSDIELLNEARGFAGRKSGDRFINPTDSTDTATFINLTILPEEEDEYPTNSEMMNAFKSWENQTDGTVYLINKPSTRSRGVMIINMETPRGLEHFVYFTESVADLTSKVTSIKAGVIPGHGGYILDRAASKSERAGVKPSDILKTIQTVNVKDVPNLLNAAKAAAPELIEQMQGYLKALAQGKGNGYVIKDGAKFSSTHQKYLGEWGCPMALITGQFDPKSKIDEMQDAMTNKKPFTKGKIQYNIGKSDALFDSTVVVEPYEILISTKAGTKGADASLKGLYDAMVDKKEKFPAEFWKNTKAKKFQRIVSIVMQQSAIDGILDLAELEKIITSADRARILQGKEFIGSKERKFVPTATLAKYMKEYKADTSHPRYKGYLHALASIARKVTEKLNNEDYTEIVKEVLNHANVVQMYFLATPKDKDLVCKGYKLVWPPKFEGRIDFQAGKNFSATEIKGKLGFRIVSKTAPKTDTDTVDDTITTASVKKVKQIAQKAKDKAVGKITKPGERDIRDIRVKDKQALGREKKK